MGGRRPLEDQPFSGCACPGGLSLLWCLGGPSCSWVRPSPRRLCTVVIRWVGGGGARPGRPHLAAPPRFIPWSVSLALSRLDRAVRLPAIPSTVVRGGVWVKTGRTGGCISVSDVEERLCASDSVGPRSLAFVACVGCGEPVNLAPLCSLLRLRRVGAAVPSWDGSRGFTLSRERGSCSSLRLESDGRRLLVRTGRTGRIVRKILRNPGGNRAGF